MFFHVEGSEPIKAKRTKRGLHQWGVTYWSEFKATAGPKAGETVRHHGLSSQHLTEAAAEKARDLLLKEAPMVTAASVVQAR